MATQLHSIIGVAPAGRIDITLATGYEAIGIALSARVGCYVATGASRAHILSPASALRAMHMGHRVSLPIACSIPET